MRFAKRKLRNTPGGEASGLGASVLLGNPQLLWMLSHRCSQCFTSSRTFPNSCIKYGYQPPFWKHFIPDLPYQGRTYRETHTPSSSIQNYLSCPAVFRLDH
ncbi:hypothetical protein N656DRAFT_783885 [Canariomyces notabilis]|uniref:Uncharacterized protein n=1 Tax=Canariomyces notabilis TaxID=2074819 RepID=A0AAN6QEC4_9PEZI|nr:hypothetical protein N656DRAFT_783885 [Canariomyces arenarius]